MEIEATQLELIRQPKVKKFAENAVQLASEDDLKAAMIPLREAFDALFDPHLPSRGFASESSPFAFGKVFTNFKMTARAAAKSLTSSQWKGKGDTGKLRAFIEELGKLEDMIRPVQDGLRLTALSIDYAQFRRFDLLVPQYDNVMTGDREWKVPEGYAPDREAFEFCLKFIVSASVKIAEAEALAADPDWLVRDSQGSFRRVVLRRDSDYAQEAAAEDV